MFKLKHKLEDLGGIFGGGSDAGAQAAAAQQAQNRRGVKELRRQFGRTQENIDPFIQAGTGALPQVTEGTTAEGLDARLARIFNTDIFGSLVGERSRQVQGALGAGGLRRSGPGLTEAARVPTDIGLMLEQLLTGRSTDLAGRGQQAAFGLGQLGGQKSQNIADLFGATGVAQGQGIITDAQSEAAGLQNILNLGGAIGGQAAAAGGIGQLASSIFFSDPSLKENVEEIGIIYTEDPKNPGQQIGLELVQWDWIEKAKGTIIEKCMNIGFMANRIKEIFPEYVSEFYGLMVVDYPSLLNRLEAQYEY